MLRQLAAYVSVVLFGLAIQMFVVYSQSVHFLGGMSPRELFSGSRLAIVTAFSTASSSATLPTALRVAEESLRLPPAVSRFVLTTGSAMNQNGTALFEGVTVLFLAQLFGVPLEGLGLILGVGRLLDMARTTVNVTGDLAAAVYVARGARAGGVEATLRHRA